MLAPLNGYRFALQPTPSVRAFGLVFVVAIHVGALATLVHFAPRATPLEHAAAIMVSIVAPEAPATKPNVHPMTAPAKAHVLTRPLPAPQHEPVKPLVAAADAPSPSAAVPAAREQIAAPESKGMTTASASPPAARAQAAAPASVIPPDFSAAYLDNPAPSYPPLSRRVGEHGQVMLRVHVTVNGAADQIELRSSSGSSRLDDAALNAVRRWRFVPARQGDRPVDAWVLIPISFSLKG